MADIQSYLNQIMAARLGEEVRGSIHDSIEVMNEESSAAQTAAISAQNSAINSAAAAKTSEDNAKTSEANAKTSADNAKISETNAVNASATVTDAATSASKSAEAAKTSETNAATSEVNAKTSETNAKNSETNAADSAKQAVAANASVTSAMTTATQAAASASTSEKNAADYAAQAAQSAGAAEAVTNIKTMTGATDTANGTGGLTPIPLKGQQDKFLGGDAKYHAITKDTLGLGNVENTADMDKPVSTATQVALDAQNDALNKEIEKTFTGATEDKAGTAGRVPAPAAGDQDKCLFGDGTFKEVSTKADGTTIITNPDTKTISTVLSYQDLGEII